MPIFRLRARLFTRFRVVIARAAADTSLMSSVLTRADRDPVAGGSSDALGSAAQLAQAPSIELALQAVREFLGMDIAYSTEHVGDRQHIQEDRGRLDALRHRPGYSLPLEETYCKRILDGDLPNMLPDVRANAIAATLAA